MKILLTFIFTVLSVAFFFAGKNSFSAFKCAEKSQPDILVVDSLSIFQSTNSSYIFAHGNTLYYKNENSRLIIRMNGKNLLPHHSFATARQVGTELPVWNSGSTCILQVRRKDESKKINPRLRGYKYSALWSFGISFIFILIAVLVAWRFP